MGSNPTFVRSFSYNDVSFDFILTSLIIIINRTIINLLMEKAYIRRSVGIIDGDCESDVDWEDFVKVSGIFFYHA